MDSPFSGIVAHAQGLTVLSCELGDAGAATLVERYGHWLSADEHERLRRFSREEPARMFLAARVLLRGVLAGLCDCEPVDLHFGKNDHEKPFLLQPINGWQFNLSHSHGALALAISRVGSVGVDIEYVSRSNPVEKLAQRYFSSREQQWLAEAAPGQFRQRFFDIWTLKEAYIKAVGKGLAVTLEGFGFSGHGEQLHYHYESGEPAPAAVHAWLCRALPDRPVACVLLGDQPAEPVFTQVSLSGEWLGSFPVAMATQI